jgi:hypothetical protein
VCTRWSSVPGQQGWQRDGVRAAGGAPRQSDVRTARRDGAARRPSGARNNLAPFAPTPFQIPNPQLGLMKAHALLMVCSPTTLYAFDAANFDEGGVALLRPLRLSHECVHKEMSLRLAILNELRRKSELILSARAGCMASWWA